MPHWECQTLTCGTCTEYPVPKEESPEDASAECILFHIYEYKVSLQKDDKERRQLELVQKYCTIGKFHRVYYLPALGRGRYHSTSYRLAAQCRQERRKIKLGSVSSHRDYGERLSVLFNEQIQSKYFQNTSMSVKGTSLEWIGVMTGLIGTGKMMANALYFNRVQRAPYWCTLSGENAIVEVRYVLQTGVQMQEISRVNNKLP